MGTIVVGGCAVATVDAGGTEHADGHVVVTDGVITAVGAGPAPATEGAEVVDGRGCLLTPGLVNTHDHLYQWATRGHVADGTLFEWLVGLYPVWAGIDVPVIGAAATSGLAWLALGGTTTTADHHYVFPAGAGDLVGELGRSAARVGVRLTVARGSMDLGVSRGGLPPDSLVEDTEAALIATEAAIDTWHDPSPGSMLQVAVAPCSPFSVTPELLTGAAELAARRGVGLHTHLAETTDEDDYCAEHFGCSPTEYMERLGWLGPRAWLAHGVFLDAPSRALLQQHGTGVAHCPSSNARLGSGASPVTELLADGVNVGLGVDGCASHESGVMVEEIRQALYTARVRRGPTGLTVRQALALATIGSARNIGRQDDIGSIEVAKRGDLALWRLDDLSHTTIADPVAALVLGPRPTLQLLLVEGAPVVSGGRLVNVDLDETATGLRTATRTLLERAAS